ncbi:MAG: adenosylcobinamide-GDP ribazoletransferase [Armatimonadetes bacterium]|nr:adenosylcobinamide-GDP ribazoletransferase [Armatimonadota bacterium]
MDFRSPLVALQFLTRIPVRLRQPVAEADIGAAAGWFPLVGLLVGALAAAVCLLLEPLVSHRFAVVAGLLAATLLTGAFHEDGLADAADGFGGGWSREQTLAIMRDSRIGTYGGLALIYLLLLETELLCALPGHSIAWWLPFAQAAGRWTTLPLCIWLPYARSEGQGGVVARRVGLRQGVLGTATLLAAGCLLPEGGLDRSLLALLAVVGGCGYYYWRRLRGVTGDCLGAANRLGVLAVLAVGAATKT